MNAKRIFFILLVGLFSLCIGQSSVSAKTYGADAVTTFDNLTSTQRKTIENNINSHYTLFGHQSVGGNILQGIDDLSTIMSIKRNLGSNSLNNFYDGYNENPDSKVSGFSNEIANRTSGGAKINCAFFKFCYVDVGNDYPEQISSSQEVVDFFNNVYKPEFVKLKNLYKDIIFVHVTIPLRIEGYSDNSLRIQFNNLLKQEYNGTNDYIFDLADIESDGGTYLLSKYAEDDSHLNELGRQRAAKAILVLLGDVYAKSSTTPPPDTIAPAITNVSVSSITSNSATITWTTDELSDSAVEYGLNTAYGNTKADNTLVTSHSITLAGLTQDTIYHYGVRSRDASNNTASSSDYTFTTLKPVNNPPVVNAGIDQTVNEDTLVTLQGVATDSENDQLTYQWTQTGGSPSVTLNNANTSTTTFTAAQVSVNTTLQFTLKVSDGTNTVSDVISVTIQDSTPSVTQRSNWGSSPWVGDVVDPVSGNTFITNLSTRPHRVDYTSKYDSVTDDYAISFPSDYNPAKSYPVAIKFLPYFGSKTGIYHDTFAKNYCDTNKVIYIGFNAREGDTWLGDNPGSKYYGSNIRNDLKEIMNELCSLFKIKYFIVTGASMGGHSAIRIATDVPQNYIGAVIASCPATFFRPNNPEASIQQLIVNTIGQGRLDNTLVFLFQGTADTTVLLSDTNKIYDATTNHTWWKYYQLQGGGHSDYFMTESAGGANENWGVCELSSYSSNSTVLGRTTANDFSDPNIVWNELKAYETAFPSMSAQVLTPMQGWTAPSKTSDWYIPEDLVIWANAHKSTTPDTTPPQLSSISSGGITHNSATITWVTDETSDSTVVYGTTTSYGSTQNTTSLITSHSISLIGLSPQTTYHYQVRSRDASNNTASSSDYTFTTLKPVNNPPVVSAGVDQTVNEGDVVTLDGTKSSDPDGDTITYLWTQTSGTDVTLSSSTAQKPTFTAMSVSQDSVLTFQLNISDGALTASDTVSITVKDTDKTITTAPSKYLIERVENVEESKTTKQIFPIPTGSVPARGVPFIQPETGHRITRISDINDSRSLSYLNGDPREGLTNGYSRFANVNVDGRYALAYSSQQVILLYEISTCKPLGILTHNGTDTIDESNDPRWDLSGTSGTETTIYYQKDTGIYKQDVLKGPQSDELIYNFSTEILSEDHMDQDKYAKYRAVRFQDEIVVLGLKQKKVLSGKISVSNGGCDISTEGQWLYVQGKFAENEEEVRFFAIADLEKGNINHVQLPCASHGHDGWAYDLNGAEVYTFQDNINDWFSTFNPETEVRKDIINMLETGWDFGQHMSRIYNPVKKGWLLMASYTTTNNRWADNQIFLLEIKPHTEKPRIWRIASTYNSFININGYFTEAFACMSYDGNSIFWGANWIGKDNLELYRVELPENWHTVLAGNPPTNQAPVLAGIGNKSVEEGKALTFTVSASDPDGDVVTVSARGIPAWASFRDSVFQGVPASDQTGEYSVYFEVTDGELKDSETVVITVQDDVSIINVSTKAEDWKIYDSSGTVTNKGESVLSTITNEGIKFGIRLEGLNIKDKHYLSMLLKPIDERVILYALVETTDGQRIYLTYSPVIGLDTKTYKWFKWHMPQNASRLFARNLDSDLSLKTGVHMERVIGLYMRGQLDVSEIKFLEKLPGDITFTAPIDSSGTENFYTNVSGSCNKDVDGVMVNGIDATAINSNFISDKLPLVSGINYITAVGYKQSEAIAISTTRITVNSLIIPLTGWGRYDGKGTFGLENNILVMDAENGIGFGITNSGTSSPISGIWNSWSIDIKTSDDFMVYAYIEADNGNNYYLTYLLNGRKDFGEYLFYSVSVKKDNTWQTITRNLDKDLSSRVEGVHVRSIKWFCVRGSPSIGGIRLSKEPVTRPDGAYKIKIPVTGSLQNPAWSPDGNNILFTRFRKGYNKGPADLVIYNLKDNSKKTLIADGNDNINLPGSCWNATTGKIVFSSSKEPHDEIYLGDLSSSPIKITNRENEVAYEPSLSPDGTWAVFESHGLDVEDNGVITKYKIDGSGEYIALASGGEDCRQPNWSPKNDRILYQALSNGQWDIWLMDINGGNNRQLTTGSGDKTDASFSPDGKQVVYSSDEGEDMKFANLYIISTENGESKRLTNFSGYDGAPSWSPDGKKIAFESFQGDPDNSSGTKIYVIDGR